MVYERRVWTLDILVLTRKEKKQKHGTQPVGRFVGDEEEKRRERWDKDGVGGA